MNEKSIDYNNPVGFRWWSYFIINIDIHSRRSSYSKANTVNPRVTCGVIGDQGLGPNAIAVLELIKDEGARMVLHQGDFDYEDDPDKWDKQISDVLGSDFPYFASIGNHDVKKW